MKKRQDFMKRISSFILVMALVLAIAPAADIAYAVEDIVAVESVEARVDLKVEGYDSTILDLKGAKIEESESALDFILRNLDENKIGYNADGGYISEVAGLKAFDKGQYSGWMTKVNGEFPNVGLGDVELKSGDRIELFYLQNYNSIFNKSKGQLIVKGFEEEDILKTEFVEYKKGETAYDFTRRLLDGNKIDYKAQDGYISEIAGLKAMDKGEYSGWMVKVDGLLADRGLADIEVGDGIVVEIFYTEDYREYFEDDGAGEVDELFVDMDRYEWAKEAVDSLAMDGVLEGTGNNKFSPEKEVTRAEFATMISRLMKLEKTDKKIDYKDVKKTDWYYEDVVKVSQKGYMKGRGAGEFAPNAKISRQEIATIVGSLLEETGLEAGDRKQLEKFKDHKDIAKWAEKGAILSVENEILNGRDTGFMPRANANRAEAATILYRMADIIK